jgi:hypothetical protein
VGQHRGATTYEDYFFKKGGCVELALAYVVDKASHMQADGAFADLDAPLNPAAAAAADGSNPLCRPNAMCRTDNILSAVNGGIRNWRARMAEGNDSVPGVVCDNDVNFDGLFEALLGAQKDFTRRLRGCKRCGWFRRIDDFTSHMF